MRSLIRMGELKTLKLKFYYIFLLKIEKVLLQKMQKNLNRNAKIRALFELFLLPYIHLRCSR